MGALPKGTDEIVVLSGDVPLIETASVTQMLEARRELHPDGTLAPPRRPLTV